MNPPRNQSLLQPMQNCGATTLPPASDLYQLAEEQLLAELVQACTSPPRSYFRASRCKPVPARRGITSLRAGTSLYQLTKELFLGKPVQALTYSARNINSSPSRYKLEPARQGAIPWWAGASRYLLAQE
ncbi:hypothetical protein PCASD_04188 [Puccinia coronata f. sp. avenae]|uniref:Uncharacterized protein n=1 Tax=Puccinia coronata f. sp. avenae TaxID=200324 RepID=A0A2N5V800_9BASI|nr:hypothetical protein PCASD_04188 [Puccinia coronata f. sp. avenae]